MITFTHLDIPGRGALPPRQHRLPTALALILALALGACSGEMAGPAPSEPDPSELNLRLVTPDSVEEEVASDVSVTVRVETPAGDPVGETEVLLAPMTGTVEPAEPTTGSDGRASAAWTLGEEAGRQTLAVFLGGRRRATVEATALPGPLARLTLRSESLLLSAYRAEARLVPSATDRFGNSIPGAEVGFSSGDTSVVTTDTAGVVSARDAGTTTVGMSAGSASETVDVTVEPRGALTVTFDDGWRSAYTEALPLLRDASVPANVALITETVGWDAYLTLPQLREMDAAGWSVVSHSVSHRRLPQLSPDSLRMELTESQRWIEEHGFRGSDVFVVPFHDWGEREREMVRLTYEAARGATVDQFAGPDSTVAWKPADPTGLTAIEADSLPYTTAAGRDSLRSALEHFLAEGRFVEVFFHRVPAERRDAFRKTVQVLAEYRGRLRPYHELVGPPRVVE